jgi:hypothetical protein
MNTLRQLADRMRKIDKELPQQLNSLIIRAAWRVLDDLVTITPVDTTAALSNWQVSVNTPVGNTIPAYVLGEHGSTYGESLLAALEAGSRTIQNKQPGQVLFISNLVDYITDLNDGSSRQAPANFVERAIIIGNDIIQQGTLLNVN